MKLNTSSNYCTDNVINIHENLKFYYCPTDGFCGNQRIFTPSISSFPLNVSVSGQALFTRDSLCAYKVFFPSGAVEDDKITIEFNVLDNAVAFVTTISGSDFIDYTWLSETNPYGSDGAL